MWWVPGNLLALLKLCEPENSKRAASQPSMPAMQRGALMLCALQAQARWSASWRRRRGGACVWPRLIAPACPACSCCRARASAVRAAAAPALLLLTACL